MLCAKCQQNEASLHFTTILHGSEEETIQLCNDCGSEIMPFPTLDPTKLELPPVIARRCEFCGKEAFSGKTLADGSAIYWCFECQAEYRRIFAELFVSEHAEFMESIRTRNFPASFSPEQFQAWTAEADQKVVQILKERRRT